HANGVVHRDLKPANILLSVAGSQLSVGREEGGGTYLLTTDNRQLTTVPKITDFGVAKCITGDGEAPGLHGPTRTGEVLGTPQYMAPEQAAGRSKEIGPAADVYALGAILD